MSGPLSRIFQAATNGNLALMLDLDGATVYRKPGIHAPVDPEPELESSLIDLLDGGHFVAINTGRPEKFVEGLFPRLSAPQTARQFWMSTETGALVRSPDRTIAFQKGVPNITGLKAAFESELAKFPGAFIEDYKMCAITVALNAARDRAGAYAHMLTVCNEAAASNAAIGIIPVFKDDDAYIEIVPRGVHKGTAAETMLDASGMQDPLILCFGDSTADENMMVVTRDRGGYAIGIGNRAPAIAQIVLDNHIVAQDLIRHLADLSAGRRRISDPYPAVA